ncbi:MAG TPA: hypothetical protein VJJ83_01435 [Candidatus Babeliales bacterium]|nr:hypothetical protein [Candidatus Babeliales bacterium]
MSKIFQLGLCFSLLAQSITLTAINHWCCRSRQRLRVAPAVVRAAPVIPPPTPVAAEPSGPCKECAVALGIIASGSMTFLTGVSLIFEAAGGSKEPVSSKDWITMGTAFGVSSVLTGACGYCRHRLGQTGAVVPLQAVDHDHH